MTDASNLARKPHQPTGWSGWGGRGVHDRKETRTQNVFCTSGWACVLAWPLSFPQKIFTCRSGGLCGRSADLLTLVTAINRLSQASGGGPGRFCLSFGLLSPKTERKLLPSNSHGEAFRDPNKLLIINWGKYAVIVAVASPFLFSRVLAECPKIK